MLRASNQLPDGVDDDIRRQLQAIQALGPHWTAHKRQLYDALHAALMKKRSGYGWFTGDCRDYHLQRKADWCLYDVPEDQRGYLGRFRGRRVRLICTGGWDSYSGRGYFVGEVTAIGLGGEIAPYFNCTHTPCKCG